MTALANRYDFVFVFDVTNGNPNGDPDSGNLPRTDPETGHGIVTDVSLKRKIRNYVQLARDNDPGYRIYVQEGSILNDKHREAYEAIRPSAGRVNAGARLNPQGAEEARALTRFMCDNFFDVRAFGAVMTTGINCGQVRGPVQLSFARSIEPIVPLEITITRMAATTAEEKNKRRQAPGEDARIENRTMGRKFIVPYAIYRAHGFVSAKLAERTGFRTSDLDLLFESLRSMFDHDRSAARAEMVGRRLIAFRHANALGNASAHELFDRVVIERRMDGDSRVVSRSQLTSLPPARHFSDYGITVERKALPVGVELLELL